MSRGTKRARCKVSGKLYNSIVVLLLFIIFTRFDIISEHTLFKGDINWKEVPIGEVARYLDKYKYNLTTAIEIEQHFAVAIVDHGKTSGMVWGETVYESQGKSDYLAKKNVGSKLDCHKEEESL